MLGALTLRPRQNGFYDVSIRHMFDFALPISLGYLVAIYFNGSCMPDFYRCDTMWSRQRIL